MLMDAIEKQNQLRKLLRTKTIAIKRIKIKFYRKKSKRNKKLKST
jgi:hypothetical protein